MDQMTAELKVLLRLALAHAEAGDEDSHHALVAQCMEVGRLEAYDRDQVIYELAKLVARLSLDRLS